ncbi:MAG: hypothetical protein GXO58_00900 [Thermodesulfobacteria bacterium]|nr:hypothetical protein [Thermodesulfobacteriota bacterium]
MKHRALLFLALVAALMPLVTGVSASFAMDKEDKRAREILERLMTLRNWQLMEEFHIKGEKAQKVFEILSKYDKERESLILKRRHLMNCLKDAVSDESTPEKELSQLMNQVLDVNIQIATIPKKEIQGLKQVFDTRQCAKYLLFSQKFAREIRAIVLRPSGKKGLAQ